MHLARIESFARITTTGDRADLSEVPENAVTALACPPCTSRTASSLNSSVYAALLPFSVFISYLLYRPIYTRLRNTFFRGNLTPRGQ